MKLKTHDWLIIILFFMLAVFGILAYFFAPKDPENAKLIIGSIIGSIAMVLSFKFGVHVAAAASDGSAAPETLPKETNN